MYEFLFLLINMEIDRNDDTALRNLMIEVLRKEFEEEGLILPAESSKDREVWRNLTTACMDRVLWDRDYEDFDDLLDAPPEVAEQTRSSLGIDRDYFIAILPDPTIAEVEQYVRELKELWK